MCSISCLFFSLQSNVDTCIVCLKLDEINSPFITLQHGFINIFWPETFRPNQRQAFITGLCYKEYLVYFEVMSAHFLVLNLCFDILVSARTGLTFCNRQEGSWPGHHYLIAPHVIAREGGMGTVLSLPRRVEFPPVMRNWGREELIGICSCMTFLCKPLLCLTPFVINIFPVTVGFIISLLFPVNSYVCP